MEELLKQELPSPTAESPDMMEGEDPYKDLIMVHMSEKEADQLDYMQGGPQIHPETELRMYPGISQMMKDPEMKQFFDDLAEEITTSGHADRIVEKLDSSLPDHKDDGGLMHAPGDFSEEGIKLGAEGEMVSPEDDIVVHIPIEYANLMDKVRGVKIVNPEDGLRQYGRNILQKIVRETVRGVSDITGIKRTHLNEFIRVGATIAGGWYGGPLGTAAGAAAGNWLTDADIKKSLTRGAKLGAAHYGAQTLAGAAGNMFGATQAAAPTVVTTNVAPTAAEIAAKAAAEKTVEAGASAGAANAGIGFGDALKYGLPLASIAMIMKGNKQEIKDRERLDREHQADITRFRKQHGMDEPLHPLIYNTQTYDPEPTNYSEGREKQHFKYAAKYAKGGRVEKVYLLPGEEYLQKSKLIEGKGSGQSDEIPVNVPEGAYVWDASSVSMLGDGSTRAGSDALDKLEKLAEQKVHKFKDKIKLSERRVPTMLSDGERVTHPLIVSVIGGGSNAKGAKFLDDARKDLRLLKISKKDKLPPKAKNILDHLPKPAQKILRAR